MIGITVADIARECDAVTTSGLSDIAEFTSISTDSRTTQGGDLFVALRGENHDGRAFVPEAIDRGATGIIVERSGDFPFISEMPEEYPAILLLEVDDILRAYQAIAKLVRRKSRARFIAVTGSTGKTTTKDMIAAILSKIGPTVATEGNFNNEYGLPATMMRIEDDTEFAVLEMGMRGTGQIAELAAIVRPHFGVITNVGLTHFELLGSRENIAAAKAELAAAMNEKGTLVLNREDDTTPGISAKTVAKTVTFGREGADFAVSGIKLDDSAKASFTLTEKADGTNRVLEICLDAPGEFNVMNAAAAAAVALKAGATSEQVIQGLAEPVASSKRMEICKSAAGATILNDTYNASPISMTAALDTLADMGGTRRIAVLGDMMELGSISADEHGEIGRKTAALSIDRLFTFGAKALAIADGAKAAGMAEDKVTHSSTIDEICGALKDELRAGDVVLIKASRALKLERIVECIK